jgi:hypothetical protein
LIQERIARQEALYQRVVKRYSQARYSGTELKVITDFAEQSINGSKTPEQLMMVVSEVLDRFPEIKLDRLHWSLGENPDVEDSGGMVQTDGDAPPPSTFPVSHSNRLYEIGFVEGEIITTPGHDHPAAESIARIAELLKKNKAVENVVIVRQPTSTGSFTGFQGGILDDQAKQQPAVTFKLKILLKQEMKS